MTSKNYGLNGVASTVQLGKKGPKLKNNSSIIEHRNAADDDFVIARGAHPIGDNDLVTKKYLETMANVYVTGQIDGGSPPAAGTPGRIFICTTTGGSYTLKYLYRDTGTAWEEIVPVEGMRISVTDALTGGTDEYTADTLYMWDADGSTWVDIGPAPAETETVKGKYVTLGYSDTGANLIKNVPANAAITKVKVKVTQAFDGTTPTIIVGDSVDDDRHMLAIENDLEIADLYETNVFYQYGSATDVNATIAASGATQGQCTVYLEYVIA